MEREGERRGRQGRGGEEQNERKNKKEVWGGVMAQQQRVEWERKRIVKLFCFGNIYLYFMPIKHIELKRERGEEGRGRRRG